MTHTVLRRAPGPLGLALLFALSLGAQPPTPRPGAQPVARLERRVLSLEDAVQMAARQSEALRIAEAGVQRARGQQVQARSQYLPQLDAQLGYQRALQNQFQAISEQANNGNNGGSGNGGAPGDSAGGGDNLADNPLTRIFASPNTFTLTVAGSQTLYSGGRIGATNRAAASGRRVAEIGVAAARAQLSLDVAQAYYDAALADRYVAIAESSLVQTERTFRQTNAARLVGNTSEFELLRARVQRDNQRPAVIQSRTQRDVAYLRLKQLIDVPLEQPLDLTTELPISRIMLTPARSANSASAAEATTVASATPGVIPARLESVAVDPAQALAEDPRVGAVVDSVVAQADTAARARSSARQARENVEVQRNQLRITRAQRLPALQLSTNYQRFAYPSGGIPSALNQFFPNWTVSLGVSVPLFTGGRIRGEELVAQANLREAEQTAQQVEELAALDAQVAISQLANAEAAWLASSGTSEEAARAYQISEVRYNEGLSTQVELSDSRLLFQQAQWNNATAARDLEMARLRLRLLRDLPLSAGGGGGALINQGPTTGQQGTGGSMNQSPTGQQQQQQTPRQGQQQTAGGTQSGPFGGGNP